MVCKRILLYIVCLPNSCTPIMPNTCMLSHALLIQSLTQACDYSYWEDQPGYCPLILYPGIPCTSFDQSPTQTTKSISQLVFLGVYWKQPLSEVGYKKHRHVDSTEIYFQQSHPQWFCVLCFGKWGGAKNKVSLPNNFLSYSQEC